MEDRSDAISCSLLLASHKVQSALFVHIHSLSSAATILRKALAVSPGLILMLGISPKISVWTHSNRQFCLSLPDCLFFPYMAPFALQSRSPIDSTQCLVEAHRKVKYRPIPISSSLWNHRCLKTNYADLGPSKLDQQRPMMPGGPLSACGIYSATEW